MKNLKKVLALGLALVMLLGMMVFVSAADEEKVFTSADITDFDKIENQAEAALLVDLGIIKGIPQDDGTIKYDPKSTIDRASWGKFIFKIMTGEESAESYKGTVTTLKDIAGHWAEGEISFLYSEGIVSGDTEGYFTPSAKVTVAAAAKMLLTAAGWNADDRSYQNSDSWLGSIMRDAKLHGLVDATQKGDDELSRDAAAKMLVRGFDLGIVEPHWTRYGSGANDKYIDSYDPQETTLGYEAYGLEKRTTVITDVDADGKATLDNGQTGFTATPDMIGQSVTYYVKTTGAQFNQNEKNGKNEGIKTAGTFVSVYSNALTAGGAKVLATVTDGIDLTSVNWYTKPGDNATDAQKAAFVAEIAKSTTTSNYDETTVDITINGAATVQYAHDGGATKAVNVTSGNKVELVDTDSDGLVDLIRVFNYTVGTVGEKGVTTTASADGKTTTVAIDGVTALAAVDSKVISGYEDLEAGDVFMYYLVKGDADKGVVIEKCDSVKFTPTHRDSSANLIDANNTKYAKSVHAGADSTLNFTAFSKTAAPKYDVEYILWLDKAGDVLCLEVADKEAAPAPVAAKYAILVDTDVKAAVGGFDPEAGYVAVKLLTNDGKEVTQEIVKVASLQDVGETSGTGVSVGTDGKLYKVNASTGLATTNEFTFFETSTKRDALKGHIVTYKEKADGTIDLILVANTIVTGKSTEKKVTPAFDFTDGQVAVEARNSTVFVVAKGTPATYYVYTGYSTIPTMTGVEGFAADVASSTNVAKFVYLTADAFEGDTPQGMYYLKSDAWTMDAATSGLVFNVVNPDGTDGTIIVADTSETATKALKNQFFTITAVNADTGFVTPSAAIDESSDFKALAHGEWADGALKYGSSTLLSYDEDTVVIVIDRAATTGNFVKATVLNGTTFATAETGYVYTINATASSGYASLVYVIRQATPAPTTSSNPTTPPAGGGE